MSNLSDFARDELRRAGLFDKDSDYGGMLGEAVMKMIEQFAEEGHSGVSAGMAISLFERLASGERHVVPLDDLKPHDHMPDCWCGPLYDEGVWVHKSADEREEHEHGSHDPS